MTTKHNSDHSSKSPDDSDDEVAISEEEKWSNPTDTDRHKNSTRQSEAQHPHDCLLKCYDVSQGNVNLKPLPKSQFLDRGSAPAATSEVYSPIRDWQTRLLALHPGQPNDVLRGTL